MLYWAENAVVGLFTIAKMHRSLEKGTLGKSEYTKISSLRLMATPYTRVLGHSAALVAGAYLILRVGESPLSLVLLVVVKTVVDLSIHLREHRALAKR